MSDWCQIENNFLTVQVTTLGAEMKRLFCRTLSKELLWLGEDKIWERSSPLLFPIVGKLKNDQFIFEDKVYTLKRHGFAREMEFDVVKADVHECEFILRSNAETLANFPFHFELSANYSLEGRSVRILYTVRNTDEKTMFFSIGAHPGFDTNNIGDYEINFEKQEDGYFLSDNGLIVEESNIFHDNKLVLNADLFSKDALIFPQLKSKYLELTNKTKILSIRIHQENATYLGIWGKDTVPFVCLEPWHGVADFKNHDGKLENKKGIISLPAGKEYRFSYRIEVIS